MQNLPPAIFFDLDDTLISFDGVTGPALEKCIGEFFGRHSPGFTKEELVAARKNAGRWYWDDPARSKLGRENVRQARRDVFRLSFKELGVTDGRLSDELADSYTDRHNELICPLPNTHATLATLKSRGIRMGLITNGASDGQRDKLKRFDLERCFDG
jgi:putative hydrolase of the HAD superfamily